MIILIILIYILSAVSLWLWVHLAHSKGGVFYGMDVDNEDIFFVFCPIVNTLGSIYSWLTDWPIKRKRNPNNFFKIKK